MKIFRTLIGAFGLSTSHLHTTIILNSNSLSLVIPEINSEDLLAKVEKYHKDNFKFNIVNYLNDGDDFPLYAKEKNRRSDYQRPPRCIKPAINPRYPQSRHGRR